MMKKIAALLLGVLMLSAVCPSSALAQGGTAAEPPLTPVDQLVDAEGNVVFNDPLAESAVREALGKPEGPITQKQLSLLGTKQEVLTIASETETTADLSILQLCTNLKSLDLEKVTPLNLSAVTSLKSLNSFFTRNIKIYDLRFLVGIPGLTDIWIGGCPVEDISAAKEIPNLVNFCIDTFVPDITPLYLCKNLTGVAVAKLTNRQVNKLLDRIGSRLYGLGLNDCGITDDTLVRISGYPLHYLMLDGAPVQTLAPVWNMRSLEGLELYKMQVNSLAGIQNLARLKEVTFGETTGIADYQPLFQVKSLRSLKLNSIKTPDLQGIQNLTNLENLTLGTLRTTVDLSPVFALSKLKYLSLNNLKIASFEGIEGLASLTDLSLYQIQGVQDYSPLSGLKKLKVVSTDIPDQLPAGLPIG